MMTATQPQKDEFYLAYERLSKEGKCDGAGGMEYRRVRAEWEASGQPENMDAFIYERANGGPIADTDTEEDFDPNADVECVLCGEVIPWKESCNPWPLASVEECCCHRCDNEKVTPARLRED